MIGYLANILETKRGVVQQLSKTQLEASLPSDQMPIRSLKAALTQSTSLSLLAEIKKASPSKGVINPHLDPVTLAQQYVSAGAAALSVLTDTPYFQGKNEYLTAVKHAVSVPVLRKDFIIDPIQVLESKVIGADAILLIVAALSKQQIVELMACAQEYGLEVLLELHPGDDLDVLAALTEVPIVGINNRDLRTFSVDVAHSLQLKPACEAMVPDACFISESALHTVAQLKQIERAGFDAALIGEGLVTHPAILEFFGAC